MRIYCNAASRRPALVRQWCDDAGGFCVEEKKRGGFRQSPTVNFRTVSALAIAFGAIVILGTFSERAKAPAHTKLDEPCNSSAAQKHTAREFIRQAGYDCRTVDYMCSSTYFVKEATVSCNNHLYKFELENHGGKWSVQPD
jgi:hypothetical protein